MTVWVFGDSFVHLDHRPDDLWMKQVANDLNEPLNCFGLGGTAIEYTYFKFNEYRTSIQENDTVIVALTDINRRWFFRDKPQEAVKAYSLEGDKDTVEAYKYYGMYLMQHTDPIYTYLYNFVSNLNYITEKLNLHTIVLFCFSDIENLAKINEFSNINFATGNLFQVCYNEFKESFITKYGLLNYAQNDLRRCHLTYSNHTILKNKIINHIKNKTPINLNEGFITNILDKHSLTDIEFSKQELFNIHLDPSIWNFHSF